MCSHQNRLIKAILMNKCNIPVWKPFYYLLCKIDIVGWLVGCFGFNGPLRQYFSLYRAVSQREGERRKKG